MGKKSRKPLSNQKSSPPKAPLPAPAADSLIWLKALLIFAAGFAIYWPSLHGKWLWDDDLLITANPFVTQWWGIFKIWSIPSPLFDFQPITASVRWLEWQIFGNNPFAFRLVNLLLHLVGALLVWRLLAKFGLRMAWLGGLIFVVHPVMVESVAWVAELKNTLSAVPFLYAVMAMIDYEAHGKRRDFWLAVGLFFVAMLCKTTMVMFPFVILLYAWWKRGSISITDAKVSAPFFAISLVMGLITISFLRANAMDLHAPHLGGLLSRVACAGLVLAFYFSKCVLPIGLSPVYPLWSVNPPEPTQFVPWLVILGIFAALLISRARWTRHVVLGLGFFVLNLLPFVGFTAGSYMSFSWAMDHILYLPIIGLIGLFVAACGQLSSMLDRTKRWIGAAALVILLGALAWQSRTYSAVFFDQEAMWSYVLRSQPDLWIAHLDLGDALSDRGALDESIGEFRESIHLEPMNPEAHYNIGNSLVKLERLPEAIAEYKAAIALNPKYARAHASLGTALLKFNTPEEGVKEYRAALEIDPLAAVVRSNLGAALTTLHDYSTAEAELKRSLVDNPSNGEGYYNLANLYFMMQRYPEARDAYLKSIELNPGNAPTHNNLGALYKATGDIPSAIREFQAALKADPTSASARENLRRLGVTPSP